MDEELKMILAGIRDDLTATMLTLDIIEKRLDEHEESEDDKKQDRPVPDAA